jgi:hypothetical protein
MRSFTGAFVRSRVIIQMLDVERSFASKPRNTQFVITRRGLVTYLPPVLSYVDRLEGAFKESEPGAHRFVYLNGRRSSITLQGG